MTTQFTYVLAVFVVASLGLQTERVVFASSVPVMEESFDMGNSPVSGGLVRGELAGSLFTDNSGWTESDIEYEILNHAEGAQDRFQRITMHEGGRMELLHFAVPCQPGRFFRLRIRTRGTPGTTTGLVLSNTKEPVVGSSYQTWWSTQIPLTDEWLDHVYILPDALMKDELRIGFNLSEPGYLDLDSYLLEAIDADVAIKERRKLLNSTVAFADQQEDYVDEVPGPRPWPVPEELTAADLPGPDGRIYPDWRYAGIPGGIPSVNTVAYVRDFGGLPDDGVPDLGAIQNAVAHAVKQGGGAVELEEGTYEIESSLVIPHDGIVLRGAGMDKTVIEFTQTVPAHSLEVITHSPGDVVGFHELFAIHAGADGLKRIRLSWNGNVLREFKTGPHSAGTHWLHYNFFHAVFGETGITSGRQVLDIEAEWDNGMIRSLRFPIRLDLSKRMDNTQIRFMRNPAAILFPGDLWTHRGRRWDLAEDLERGDTELVVDEAVPVKKGDVIRVSMPRGNPVFLERTRSARSDIPRSGLFFVKGVSGNRVILNQPARIDYPASQGARVESVYPIRGVGAEDFTLTQTHKHWTHGIVLDTAVHSWIRNVKVDMAGRNPIGIGGSKQVEVRDSEFNDAWYLGGGGTGYISFSSTYDSLMENILTRRLRHAPNAQWGAQGNVFRNSTFIQSDAQFHMGWAVENLFENCVVDAAVGSGSYGYGLYVQKPEVEIHGPGGGPRNVMYNNDFVSPRSGVLLGGSNQGWKILHNRFVVNSGPGIIVRDRVFDLDLSGNHVHLESTVEPFVEFEGTEITEIDLHDNRMSSVLQAWWEGDVPPTRSSGNIHTEHVGADLPRPSPAMPSIFTWQRENHPLPTASYIQE